jgi:hypothetical protein
MAIKGLEQAISNLESISSRAVPRASAQAVNRIAARAVSRSAKKVAAATRVPRKLVNQRARIKKASVRKPVATIRVNRGNLPVIKLGVASVRLSRRKRDVKGAASVLHIGKFRFPGAFIQQLASGRWQVLRRTTKSRYPVEVLSIPLAVPLTENFRSELNELGKNDLPKEFSAALRNQLRLAITR